MTILKAAHGKGNRGGYDLHQVHSSVPQPPAFGFVPWIPVDPAVVLPFHQQHGRVPCTFPPTPIVKVCIHVFATVTLLIQNIVGKKISTTTDMWPRLIRATRGKVAMFILISRKSPPPLQRICKSKNTLGSFLTS